MSERWYWLDWLRVLAMGIVFLYHSGMPFVTAGRCPHACGKEGNNLGVARIVRAESAISGFIKPPKSRPVAVIRVEGMKGPIVAGELAKCNDFVKQLVTPR